MEERIIDANTSIEDIFDKSIRPESLDEYVGQDKDVLGRPRSVRYGASGLPYADGRKRSAQYVGARQIGRAHV